MSAFPPIAAIHRIVTTCPLSAHGTARGIRGIGVERGGNRFDVSAHSANRCWDGGGFYTTHNRAAWQPSYDVFDTNHDGYLSADEYWNAQAYGAYDCNHDSVIVSSEWPW